MVIKTDIVELDGKRYLETTVTRRSFVELPDSVELGDYDSIGPYSQVAELDLLEVLAEDIGAYL